MTGSPRKLLVVSTHAIQYMGPLYRVMAKDPRLDVLVAYCSLQGAEAGMDPEFGIPVKWDVPILDGYQWIHVPNRAPSPGIGRFFGLINPGLWALVRGGGFDAVLVYGYANVSYWIAILASYFGRTALLLGTDATSFAPRDQRGWKLPIKRVVLPAIFRLADAVCGPSTAGVRFLRTLGIDRDRVFLAHYTIDNAAFAATAARSDRARVRQSWTVPPGARVVLFCGKLQSWKRPGDLLRAFARACVAQSYLVIVGEGPLRDELEVLAGKLGVKDRVRFLGFVNQSELPEVYAACDVLVLPSQHEPWGLVVNEAMVCGCGAIVSDRVGAREDLIIEGETGYSYRAGDIQSLSELLTRVLGDEQQMRRLGQGARRRMEHWSYREHVHGIVAAIDAAVSHKRHGVIF